MRRFCDLDCPDAMFPEEEAVDGARSCRTFVAIRCRRLNRLVHKNLPCPAGLPPAAGPGEARIPPAPGPPPARGETAAGAGGAAGAD
jgi:hypothetical protein